MSIELHAFNVKSSLLVYA